MISIHATPSRLRQAKWSILLSEFDMVIQFLFAPNLKDFQFAHLNYKHFIDSMKQSGQIHKNLTSEAKELDAKRNKSRQNEMRQL